MPKALVQNFSLETVALFPKGYFLENLAVRSDGSILVTVLNKGELWLVPNPTGKEPVTPLLIDRIENLPMGIVEVEPDVFYISTLLEPTLERIDLRAWAPGSPVQRARVLTFPGEAKRLNGACLLGPNVLAIADGAAGLIWRVDLAEDGFSGSARIWLQHPTMAPGRKTQEVSIDPPVTIPFPGVNGVRFVRKSNHLYYTSSAEDVFARVAVDSVNHEAVGEPDVLATGFEAADDFCIDERERFAYVATHITNTIQRVSLDPTSSSRREIVVGTPFTDELIGPSSLVWADHPTAGRHVAYVTTDGGLLVPGPGGVTRPSALLRFISHPVA